MFREEKLNSILTILSLVLPLEFAYEYLERLCSDELSVIAFFANLAFGLLHQLVVCLPNELKLIWNIQV